MALTASACQTYSTCSNVTQTSNSSTAKLPKVRYSCMCGRQSVCINAFHESVPCTGELRKQCCRKEKIRTVCGNESVCYSLSTESDSSSEKAQKQCTSRTSRKENITVCGNQSVCRNASTESDLCTEQINQCIRDEILCACENRSVCCNASDTSSSSTETLLEQYCSKQKKRENFLTSTCGHYSTCYNMAVEPDYFTEELLRLLHRPRRMDEPSRHWEMMLHCERAAFPRAVSNLPLPSREARFYWHLYSAAMKQSRFYQKDVNHALLVTLAKLVHGDTSKRGLSLWDELIRPKTFDRLGRKNLINRLEQLIRKQTSLESISLEGLSLTPAEGVRLLLALYNSRKTMRYVYCWRAFEKMSGLSDAEDRVGSRFYTGKRIEKCDWFRAIGSLEFLTSLSVNYAYVATPTGDLLINLAKKLGANWHWLQLLCLEEEILRRGDSGSHAGAVVIPDHAWRKIHFWAPMLKVQYAIVGIPEYDVHKRLYTRSTPVHTFALSTNIDLRFRQPWFLDCTLKTLFSWYSNTLVYLCLHLWHNRENLDNQLRKLFLNLPLLQVFEFIGEIRTLKTLCAMCCQIRSCSCNVRRVNLQLQEVVHDDIDKEKWMKSINCLTMCFKHDFDRMGVKFDISFYCC